MGKRNYYRFNQDPWNDEIYKPIKKENDMVDENQNENENQAEEVSAEDWNAACDHWDMLHDLHGLEGF
tara:strand:+ start:535 stop:738 length:204 start_codon:yes stop_codon:yes gene_type:complete